MAGVFADAVGVILNALCDPSEGCEKVCLLGVRRLEVWHFCGERVDAR
jgi:hypothetical protein